MDIASDHKNQRDLTRAGAPGADVASMGPGRSMARPTATSAPSQLPPTQPTSTSAPLSQHPPAQTTTTTASVRKPPPAQMTFTSAPVHKPPPAQMTSTSVPPDKPPPARKASTTVPLTQSPPAQVATTSAPLNQAPPAQMMSTPAPLDQSPTPQRTCISAPSGQPLPAPTASTSAPSEPLPPAQTASIAAPLDQPPEQTTSAPAPWGQLPPDWDEVYDPDTNQPFFVKFGGHVQWRDPRSSPPPPLPSASVVQPHGSTPAPLGQLPPGWDEVYDKVTNQPFFINNSSGHVQWRHPRQAPPPPPPRPPAFVVQPHGLPSMNETKRKRHEEHFQGPPVPLAPRGSGSDSHTAALTQPAATVAAQVSRSVNASPPTMPLAMRTSSSQLPSHRGEFSLFDDLENVPPRLSNHAVGVSGGSPAVPLKRDREASSEMHHGVPVISELRQSPARSSLTTQGERPSPYAVDRRVRSSRPKGKGRAECNGILIAVEQSATLQ